MSFSREGPLGNFCSEGAESEGKRRKFLGGIPLGERSLLSACVSSIYILILLNHVETMWKGSCTLPQVPGFLSGIWPFPHSPLSLSLFPHSSLLSLHLLCMFLGEEPLNWMQLRDDSQGFSLCLTLGHSGAQHHSVLTISLIHNLKIVNCAIHQTEELIMPLLHLC